MTGCTGYVLVKVLESFAHLELIKLPSRNLRASGDNDYASPLSLRKIKSELGFMDFAYFSVTLPPSPPPQIKETVKLFTSLRHFSAESFCDDGLALG